jgi:hypothetical protein
LHEIKEITLKLVGNKSFLPLLSSFVCSAPHSAAASIPLPDRMTPRLSKLAIKSFYDECHWMPIRGNHTSLPSSFLPPKKIVALKRGSELSSSVAKTAAAQKAISHAKMTAQHIRS